MTLSVFILIVCLALSFFFSGTETAFTAASDPFMHEMEKKGNKRAKRVLWLKKHSDRFLGTVLFGNNVVNIAATAITTSLCISLFGEDWGIFVSTFVVSMFVLIFCEILPKTIAVKFPNTTSLALSTVISDLTFLLSPFILFLNALVKHVMQLLGLKKEKIAESAKTELRGTIDLKSDETLKSEKNMLKSVLDLDDVSVGDVMTHRSKIISFNVDLPLPNLIEEITHCPYTRIPLWRGKKANIVGVLHTKLLFRALNENRNDLKNFDIMSVTAQPWFVLETTSLLDQLQAYRKRHEHFAFVVDEYGVIQGIVTLEDILEEIVGDIVDETDHPADSALNTLTQADGSIIVDGMSPIRDLNRQFGWELPDEEASTLAGLLLYETERIPRKDSSYCFYGFHFKVLDKKGQKITRVLITPPPKKQETNS